MSSAAAKIVRLSQQHERKAFSCGVAALDRYLHTQAGQDTRRDIAAVYVLEGDNGKTIRGYYTLSACGVSSTSFPPEIQKHCPRYDLLPAYLIGRLAIDQEYRGQGLGETLLVDALQRCVRQHQSIAAMAVVVDAIDDNAVQFYRHYHFETFPETPHKLFIRMNLLVKLFEPNG